MKNYESLVIQHSSKLEQLKNNKSLEPIMEYDYYFQNVGQYERKVRQNHLYIESEKVKDKMMVKQQKINNKKIVEQNKTKANQSQKPNKQNINKYNATYKSQNGQITKINKQKSSYNSKESKLPNKTNKQTQPTSQKPLKQPKVLTQHNPIAYSSTLFPQPQSIKQKLKQNLQQQMLSNYYISKYSTIMSKITNENIKIQLPQDMTERSFSNNKDNQSLISNKKRKNFKEVMKQKGVKSQKGIKIQQHNQSVGKRRNFNNYQTQNIINTPLQNQQQNNESLNITFSPVKVPLIARNDKRPFQQKLSSSNRSYHSRESSISQSNRGKSSRNFSSQKQRQNQESLRESQKIRESQLSFKSKNFQERSSSPENRLNFKQSLKQKKSLYLEYQQNYDLYKKLESSIIDQLYSPSPKKIERDKFNEICFIDRQLTIEERKMLKSKEKNEMRDFYDESLFKNIEINEVQFQQEDDEKDVNRENSKEKDNASKTREIDLLRQSIKKSIQSINNCSEMSSPSLNSKYDQKNLRKGSPSRKSSSQSPKRTFTPNKNKTQSPEGSRNQTQREEKWNANFYSVNSHNKKYLNMQSPSKKIVLSPRNPPDSEKRKYHSLKKHQTPETQKAQIFKRLQSRSKSKKFSQQKFPINEQENDFESDQQNNLQTATDHNESYNEVSKILGNEVSMSVNLFKPTSSKAHQRKGSFHSVRSDRKFKNQQSIESRYVAENFQTSRKSNETVNEPSQQEDEEDVEFVPAANENMFSEKGSQGSKSKYSSPTRKNLIETVGRTRSRKPSDHFSFISDEHSHHELSMLSRFSMTSQEGSMIIHKLENEITQNEFGPYQHALQSLRQLLYEHRTAWPIYVVGQKILDDRSQYEKKIELQAKMIEDYKEKILQMKKKQQQYKNETDEVRINQFKILKLIRQLCSNNK